MGRYTPPKPKHRLTIVAGVLVDGRPLAFVIEDCSGCSACITLVTPDPRQNVPGAEKRNGPSLQARAVQVPSRRTQEKHHDCRPT